MKFVSTMALAFFSTQALSYSVDPPFSKSQWGAEVKKNFYKEFCIDEKLLKICYNLTHYQCQKVITHYADECIKKGKIPQKINTYKESESLGEKVGLCIGIKFNRNHPRKNEVQGCS